MSRRGEETARQWKTETARAGTSGDRERTQIRKTTPCCGVTLQASAEKMINSEGKTLCFVCNLPIQSHQVGLVWQGGNGVDDLLREQVDQDIIRGRLGRGHRRDSSAQITTIDSEDCVGLSTPPITGKRRRSSLAHLGDLIHSWGSRDRSGGEEGGRKGEKAAARGQSGAQQSRRGTLHEIR